MPEPFSREERNQTVWQRRAHALLAAGVKNPNVIGHLHRYVLREREDARRNQ